MPGVSMSRNADAIDLDDIERRYYVYMHRDKKTQVPFYIGKGTGRRAYDTIGRHPRWFEIVKSLTHGYEVQIIADDLSEAEAFDQERDLIAKYGRESEGLGPLVNITEGGMLGMGEGPLELGIGGELGKMLDKAQEAVFAARQFRSLSQSQAKAILQFAVDRGKQLFDRIDSVMIEEEETDLELDLDSRIWQLRTDADFVLQRKISLRDFAHLVVDEWEDVDGMLEDVDLDTEKPAAIAIARDFRDLLCNVAAQLFEGDPRID